MTDDDGPPLFRIFEHRLTPAADNLLARFLEIRATRDTAVKWVSDHFAEFPSGQVEQMLASFVNDDDEPEIAQTLFTRSKDGFQEIAVGCFARIAAHNVAAAERLAAPIIAGPDTELRKGVIVVLADAQSAVGQSHIDEAFTGSAHRLRLFKRLQSFVYGSRAADEYKRLCHHDYFETGKTWPPSTGAIGVPTQDPAGWRSFIDRYPWFPGTDDAYYQLAFAQYARDDVEGALATITEYAGKQLPDTDAEPYIMYLLRILSTRSASLSNDNPLVQNVRTVTSTPVAAVIWGSADSSGLLTALKWFLADPARPRFLLARPKEIKDLVSLLEGGMTVPDEASSQSDEQTPAWVGDPNILYSIFFVPNIPDREHGHSDKTDDQEHLQALDAQDPGGLALRSTARKIEAVLASAEARRTDTFAAAVSWTLMHMESNEPMPTQTYNHAFQIITEIPTGDLSTKSVMRTANLVRRRHGQ